MKYDEYLKMMSETHSIWDLYSGPGGTVWIWLTVVFGSSFLAWLVKKLTGV